MPIRTIIVVAGIVYRENTVLLTQRKADAHLAGAWEFPGGKVEDGEEPRAALARELHEELGISVEVGDIVEVTYHHYVEAGRAVLLLFYEATLRPESPAPIVKDVAAFEWGTLAALDPARFPAADIDVLRKVRARLAARAEAP